MQVFDLNLNSVIFLKKKIHVRKCHKIKKVEDVVMRQKIAKKS